MRAVTWHGKHDVRVDTVPDPTIQEPTDVIVKITSTGICGSDLHLYSVLGPFLDVGDILGHEPMGVVAEVGPEVTELQVGDRVVVPFNVSCGTCFMCGQGLHSQCETTQVRERGKGAALFGYTKLYGQVPGGQAEYLRVPFGNTLPIKIPDGPPDDRFVYLSDVLPTAWQARRVRGRAARRHATGARPRADRRHGHPGRPAPRHRAGDRRRPGAGAAGPGPGQRGDGDRPQRARRRDLARDGPRADRRARRRRRARRGRAWRHTARRSGTSRTSSTGLLPDAVATKLMETAGVDRLAALYSAIELVRRGGTISLSGVYGGMADPMPMMTMFDKQIQLRMGQANVHRWVPDILPLLLDGDPLGTEDFATHRLPLDAAPEAYATFQAQQGRHGQDAAAARSRRLGGLTGRPPAPGAEGEDSAPGPTSGLGAALGAGLPGVAGVLPAHPADELVAGAGSGGRPAVAAVAGSAAGLPGAGHAGVRLDVVLGGRRAVEQ